MFVQIFVPNIVVGRYLLAGKMTVCRNGTFSCCQMRKILQNRSVIYVQPIIL